jgi:hypothetical protein
MSLSAAVTRVIVSCVRRRPEDRLFTTSFELPLPIAAGTFFLAALLALALPPTAIREDEVEVERGASELTVAASEEQG